MLTPKTRGSNYIADYYGLDMGHEYNEKVFFCSHIIHPVCATSSLVEEKEKEKREKR